MRLVLKHIAKRLRLKNNFVVILRTILNEKEFRQDKIFKITRKKQLKVFMIYLYKNWTYQMKMYIFIRMR